MGLAPDLEFIQLPHEHGFFFQTSMFAQRGRNQQSAIAIQFAFAGIAKQQALCNRRSCWLRLKLAQPALNFFPFGEWKEQQTGVVNVYGTDQLAVASSRKANHESELESPTALWHRA